MISSALGALVCVAALLFLLFAAITVAQRNLPVGNMIVMAIVFPLLGLVPGYILRLLWAQIRAALHRGNWVARLSNDGIYLNLRSYLNWRLSDETPTLAYVPYAAIAHVFEVREQLDLVMKVSADRYFHAFVVLKLKPEIGLGELDQTIRGEILRVVEHPGFISGTDAWCEVPLFVCGEDEIWISRRDMFLLRALAKRVPRKKQVWLETSIGDGMTPDDLEVAIPRLRWAILHGYWTTARQIAQFKLGFDYDETFDLLSQHVLGAKR